eukprot:scaffold135633_cov20-Tisochrysis_lutea.AAC.1
MQKNKYTISRSSTHIFATELCLMVGQQKNNTYTRTHVCAPVVAALPDLGALQLRPTSSEGQQCTPEQLTPLHHERKWGERSHSIESACELYAKLSRAPKDVSGPYHILRRMRHVCNDEGCMAIKCKRGLQKRSTGGASQQRRPMDPCKQGNKATWHANTPHINSEKGATCPNAQENKKFHWRTQQNANNSCRSLCCAHRATKIPQETQAPAIRTPKQL